MTVTQALVLGLVQGLAEFLPISSSAHLSLTPWLLGWRDPGLAFDVALHVGTLAAVLWYFRLEWARLARAALWLARGRRPRTDEERRVGYIVLATAPAALAGLMVKDYAETVFRSPALTASALIAMGIVLWAVDRWSRAIRPLSEMRVGDALLLGCAQVFALIPGVSRSGSTMTAARALGFSREGAAAFSFLMSMPITFAAAVIEVPEAVREGVSAPLVVGVLTSAASGWIAITVLLRYVARHSFGVFAAYRIALGVLVFVVLGARG
ncbi:MAG TPA: undecaprenyl-diphosphate phosphatase [Gemmatimonadaceae bacterium]|nr:undecaprenyl-diphosphate phosphatase [Gemmatimonadaceae bacterium]